MRKPKAGAQRRKPAEACLISAATAAVVLFCTAALSAFLIGRQILPQDSIPAVAAAAVLLAALLGPQPLLRALGRKPMTAALIWLAAFLAVIVAIRMAVWPDSPFGGWLIPAAAAAGAVLGGFLGSRKPRRRR